MRSGANLKQLQMLRSLASVPPIPRDPPSEKHVSSDRMVTYKLSVQPGVPGAPEVKKAFPKFGAGSESDSKPEEYSEAVANFVSVWDGLAIGNGPGRKAIVEQVPRSVTSRPIFASAARSRPCMSEERFKISENYCSAEIIALGSFPFCEALPFRNPGT